MHLIENTDESEQKEKIEMQEKDAIKDSEILDETAEVTESNLMINQILIAPKTTKDD